VLLDAGTNSYYLLLAGRWFRGPALAGPWAYLPSANLPADSPAGIVLVAVAGTPQAEEAAITNSIPQAATVPRVNGPKFTPTFDGTPQFQSIEGTTLQYVVNSAVPVIRVDASTYYAIQTGVWFYSTTLTGPWYAAPAASGASGAGATHTTTVTNPNTGQSKSSSTTVGHVGNTAYAEHNGNVYTNSGSGWQQHTSSGSQNVSKPPESVQNEAAARSQGEEKYNNFKQSGGEAGGWGGRSGGSWGGGGGGGRRR
jgi:hypothetical protein